MDLKQVLMAVLALVASTSGFLQTRNIRPRLIHRQTQRRYPQISMVTNLSKNPSRPVGQRTPPSGGQHTGINQKFTLNSRPRNSGGAINIISNIILQHPPHQPATPTQRHQNMPGQQQQQQQQPQPQQQQQQQQQQHNPARGQGRRGQGRVTSGRQHRQGQRVRPYNVFNRMGGAIAGGTGGARTGQTGQSGQQTHGRSPMTDFGVFHGSRHLGSRPIAGGAGQHSTGSQAKHGLQHSTVSQAKHGPQHSTGSQAGHGPHAQLTVPLVNGTDFLAFFQSIQNASHSSPGATGGNPSHIVLLPQGSNTRAVVLSANPGMVFSGISSKGGLGGAFGVLGGSNPGANVIMTTQTPGEGFTSMTTLQPGEDPPEIEHPSA